MKVVLITRSTLFSTRGGDTIQVLKTVKYLRRLNVSIDIKLTNEKINYQAYDLLHFFNLTRPSDILPHLKKDHPPFVVTPLLIDYSEFDKNYRKGFVGKLFRFLSPDQIEFAKTIGRWIRRQETVKDYGYLLKGQTHSVKRILGKASLLLPNSQMEYTQLLGSYAIEKPYMVVPNGIDTDIFTIGEEMKKDEKMVLCVARTEGLKNQLNLIKALNHSDFQLYLIGNHAPNQTCYYVQCRKISAPNVHFREYVPQRQLIQYYQRAKVHILPSWFETCGLSSLEAAAMGCNIVITRKGYAPEYFQDNAFYCNPSSPSSIRSAVEEAAAALPNKEFQQKIFSQLTWQHAAAATCQAYKSILI